MFEKEPDLLTRRQAQELLQVSKNTILKMNCPPSWLQEATVLKKEA